MNLRARAAVLLGAASLLCAGAATASAPRPHRLRVPPRPAFPRALSIDESEFTLGPSRTVVSSGRVRLNVYNRGMDDHDVTVYDAAGGELGKALLQPSASDQIVVTLPAGDYRVVCSLFAGTPVSHEAYGMRFTLRVQDPPRVPGVLLPAQRR